jgi:creatinine amidohydrolase
MFLEDETTEALEAASDDETVVALLPVGSTEQHGPALPLGTDTKAAEAVSDEFGERENVVVLPPIPFGVSAHHRQFHGTIWVSPETMKRYVREVVESLAAHEIDRVIVVNGHGGNVPVLEELAKELYRNATAFVVPWSWWEGVGSVPSETIDEDVSVPGHAGAFETAMMLAVAPDLVVEDDLERAALERGDGSRFDDPGPMGYDFVDWTDNGVSGDPRMASAAAGEGLQEAAVESLSELVEWLSGVPEADLEPRPHR